MARQLSRRGLLTGIAASAAFPGFAETAFAPATSLLPRDRGGDFRKRTLPALPDMVAQSKVSGRSGLVLFDAGTGDMLEGHGAGLPMPPASVAKALTAVYALRSLGPGHHFETRIIGTGPVENGVLNGDLVLQGGGDPTLDTDALATLAQALKDSGLIEVKGRFLVHGGPLPSVRLIDTAQPDHVGYNPAVSGLNLNFNRVHFEWRRNGANYTVTMDARSETLRPAVSVAKMAVIDRKVPIYTYADQGGRDAWTVAKGALGGGGARWLPVRRPELYAGDVFATLLRSQGIVLKKPMLADTAPGGSVLARHQSAPLRIILRDMLRYSTNLTAEVVGMAATKARSGTVTGIAQSAKDMSDWYRETYGLGSCALVDHSGLGEASRITAQDMAKALVQVNRDVGLKAILRPVAMRDEKRKVIKDHPASARAKTGTLNFVSGLAGYLTARDGRELVFATFSADLERRADLSKAERERPPGGKEWNRRARMLQQRALQRWDILFGT